MNDIRWLEGQIYALKLLLRQLPKSDIEEYEQNEYVDTLKHLDNILKKLKALEIINGKLKIYLDDNFKTINAVLPIASNEVNKLNEEEYKIVKEVLK